MSPVNDMEGISLSNYFQQRRSSRFTSKAALICMVIMMLLTLVMVLVFKDTLGERVSGYLFGRAPTSPNSSSAK